MRALFIALVLTPALAAAQNCPLRSYPGDEWPNQVAATAASKATQLKALEDYTFTLVGTDAERKGIRTDGLVIIKNGNLIYERYARGYAANKRHILWSVTKTLSMTIAGLAVKAGLLNIDGSICNYMHAPDRNCSIKVKDLLEMGSGLDWLEEYEDKSNQESSVLAMFYGEGQKDMARFAAYHERIAEPGQRFNYSTGEALLVAAAARGAGEKQLGRDFPWTLQFDKIGAKSVVWERDAAGNWLGGSHAYMTPKDMARVGYYLMADGCWNGERLLPEGWLAAAFTPNPTWKIGRDHPAGNLEYGRQIWLNRPQPDLGYEKPWKDAPDDTVVAIGHWGQYIVLIPSLDLVIARTGDDRDPDAFDENTFIKLAIDVAGGTP